MAPMPFRRKDSWAHTAPGRPEPPGRLGPDAPDVEEGSVRGGASSQHVTGNVFLC